MATGYVVFNGLTEGKVISLHPTQALANAAAAAAGSGVTAHPGAVEMSEFSIGHSYFDGAAVVLEPDPPPTLADDAQRTVESLIAAQRTFDANPAIASAQQNRLHDWLAMGVCGVVQVVLSAHWTTPQKKTFAAGMRAVPDGLADTAAPSSPLGWVDPADGTVWTGGMAAQRTSELVAPHWVALADAGEILTGAWLDRIPATE